MSLTTFIIIFLILLVIAWFFSCYFIFYAWLEIGENDGNDSNLHEASKNLWYASLTSWVTLSIIFILIVICIIIGIILLIFIFPLVLDILAFIADIFLSLVTGIFTGKVSIINKIIIYTFFGLALIFTFVTGYYALISAHYINKGVYDSSQKSIVKSLRYCYYTASISVVAILIIVMIIFAVIYLSFTAHKAK